MTKLSGLVAVPNARGDYEFRDLGPVPVDVKAGVLPATDDKPVLADDEEYEAPVIATRNGVVTRTYTAQKRPPEPPSLEEQLAAIEARIAALENAR